jgi:hypothetical protein
MATVKCDQCQIGRCRPVEMTYMRKLGSYMVVLPNAPAGRCDVCGQVSFDRIFLETMQTLMENFVRDPQRSRQKKTSVTEPSPEWTPLRGTSK